MAKWYHKGSEKGRQPFIHEVNAFLYLSQHAPAAVQMACIKGSVVSDGISRTIRMEEAEGDVWDLFHEVDLTVAEVVRIVVASFKLLSCLQGYVHHGDCKADNIVLFMCTEKPEGCVFIPFRSVFLKFVFIDFATLYTFKRECPRLDASYQGTVSGVGFYGRRPLEAMRRTAPAVVHQSDVYTLTASFLDSCIPN